MFQEKLNSISNAKPFRILSIDGGGYRGLYSSHVLKRINDEFNINWPNHFDMIAGTSTGAIIAAALACGISTEVIKNLYLTLGEEIFKTPLLDFGGFHFKSKYKSHALKGILSEVFQERTLGDLKVPLLIPASDIGNGRVHVFKSGYSPEFVRDKHVKICDAILASCSAPLFFDPTQVDAYLLSDGGLWANNPSLLAAIESKRKFGQELKNIKILSIGTGSEKHVYTNRKNVFFGWGFFSRWKHKKFIQMLLDLQSQTASNIVNLLLEDEQILRITFESDQCLPMDDPKLKEFLVSRADLNFTHESKKISEFLGVNNAYSKC